MQIGTNLPPPGGKGMGMATIGFPWVPWDSHGNGNNNDYIMGMEIGVGIKVWEWKKSYGKGNEFPLQLFNVSYEILFRNA